MSIMIFAVILSGKSGGYQHRVYWTPLPPLRFRSEVGMIDNIYAICYIIAADKRFRNFAKS